MAMINTWSVVRRALVRHPAAVVAWVFFVTPPVVRGAKEDAPRRVEDSRGGCRAVWTGFACGDGIADEWEACDRGEYNVEPETALPGECTRECKVQPGCGDGKIDAGAGEQCDGGDWCSGQCMITEGCGNGVTEMGEACDGADGTMDKPGATCTELCTLIWCGDGVVQDGEDCDDGNSINEDACTNACTVAQCGDGFVQPGEACDDGNQVDDDNCKNDCSFPGVCGDGLKEGAEACDDGDDDDNDACLKDCTAASCGDGKVWAGMEACDDGNEDDTDACLAGCKLPSCGDGFVQAGVEDCDDKDLDDLDECNNDCAAPRFVFLTSTSGNLGALGGVAGADAHCQNLANGAGLSGTYAAWLTDGDETTEPAQRFKSAEFKGWYVLPTKPPTRVARGWTDLTMPNEAMPMNYLQAAITATEKGVQVNGANVWTNTKFDGTQASPDGHCDNWTWEGDADIGQTGLATAGVLGATWTVEAPYKCGLGMRLYCFEASP